MSIPPDSLDEGSPLNSNAQHPRLFNISLPMHMLCYFLQHEDTHIHLALRDGHVEVVEKLIRSGANVNVVDKVSVNY